MSDIELARQLRLYAVTDRSWLGSRTLSEQIEAALQGGITMLQLREKQLSKVDFLAEALVLKQLAKRYKVPLIINDNLEIACQSDADGLHIGQQDCLVADARKMLGKDKILGVSAQTIEQALAAETDGADYLGVGAVFATSTKTDAKLVDIPTLKAICKTVKIPVVAIGGINLANLRQIADSGIVGVALVSAIFAQPKIMFTCQNLKRQLDLLF